MRKLRTLLALVAVGCMGMGSFGAVAASSKASIAAESATALTTEELLRLYSNRSWLWKDGAGYFRSKQRSFIAATGRGKAGSYGIGRWFLTDPGKLCFRAEWHAKSGAAPALTCFSHRKKGGVVFQKREPDGEWYAFKHAPVKSNDEYRKLRPGDYVSANFKKIRSKLSASR
jgi:Protein of unknown function (DUF995)